MKLKYYLRGLGIGIIVTAILMGLATKDKNEMTDEEIKARAATLGMVEQKVLSDISNTSVPVGEDMNTPEPSEEPVTTKEPLSAEEPDTTKEPEVTEVPGTNVTPEPTETPKPTETPEATEEPDSQLQDSPQPESEYVTLVISSGETSWSISQALFDLGMVESASDFDRYLCQNGYDKTIRIGIFEIPKSATYAEISQIIAR